MIRKYHNQKQQTTPWQRPNNKILACPNNKIMALQKSYIDITREYGVQCVLSWTIAILPVLYRVQITCASKLRRLYQQQNMQVPLDFVMSCVLDKTQTLKKPSKYENVELKQFI